MGGSRGAYPPAFRRQMVELVRAGRTPEELSREFEPTAQSIWNWVWQADRDAGRRTAGVSVRGPWRMIAARSPGYGSRQLRQTDPQQ
jgi:transposase